MINSATGDNAYRLVGSSKCSIDNQVTVTESGCDQPNGFVWVVHFGRILLLLNNKTVVAMVLMMVSM